MEYCLKTLVPYFYLQAQVTQQSGENARLKIKERELAQEVLQLKFL